MFEYGTPNIEAKQTINFLFLSNSALCFIEFGLGRALYMSDKLNLYLGAGKKKRLVLVIFRQLFQS